MDPVAGVRGVGASQEVMGVAGPSPSVLVGGVRSLGVFLVGGTPIGGLVFLLVALLVFRSVLNGCITFSLGTF